MPLYLFKCGQCGVAREVLQAFTDPPPMCPTCGVVMDRHMGVTHWQRGTGPKESNLSRAIKRVQSMKR